MTSPNPSNSSAWSPDPRPEQIDPATGEPRLNRVTMRLCDPCIDGNGGECHTPGCDLWLCAGPDIPIRARIVEMGGSVTPDNSKEEDPYEALRPTLAFEDTAGAGEACTCEADGASLSGPAAGAEVAR